MRNDECPKPTDDAARGVFRGVALAGYRIWVERVREAVALVPVTITALPSWMRAPEFGPLVRATDGYVLQVHALERPDSADDTVALVARRPRSLSSMSFHRRRAASTSAWPTRALRMRH